MFSHVFSVLIALILQTTANVTPKIDPPTLHVVGDSQACGAGWAIGKVDETKAWGKTKVTCKGGTRVQYWYDHVDEAGLKPGDSVLVYLGSNNWGDPPDPKPLLAKIKASGAQCVWVGPPLIYGKDGAAPYLKKAVTDDGTCVYLDSRELKLILGDKVHPATLAEHMRWLRAGVQRLPKRP